ncbi:MAG: porin [Chitinophagaceae bacterium]|nr:porin [Chitinophagaceae bacterium]MCB9047350.1 porin [Chitinophagales bacterium]
MDLVDTTTDMGRGVFAMYQNYNALRISGYMQPQFQVAEGSGIESYAGGDFPKNVDSRFMLRRGRIRLDYAHYNKDHQSSTNFVFQFDGTERGVNIRDFWGRFYENKWQYFAITTGMFARPFSYEVNLSSSNRETPERGRMSQILMKTERDMGVMLTFSPRKEKARLKWLKADVGVFNGQGLAGPAEYDSRKDIIGRISMKPQTIKPLGVVVSAAFSTLQGGVINQSPMYYTMKQQNSMYVPYTDSVNSNIGKVAPRRYYGGDVQVKIPNRKGATEFRAEYITGLQSATSGTSQTPGSYPTDKLNNNLPLYVRPFNGAYFYFLQHLGTEKAQLVLKYDWYDPNTTVSGNEIDKSKGFSAADIRYDTFGFGGVYYANPHMKFFVWYDIVTNETTVLNGYTKDIKDNVLTVRVQYSF